MFIAFLTSSKRFIIVMDKWVKCPEINQKPTLAFFSPNPNDEANFDLDVKYLFYKNEAHVYNGFVMRSFESKDEAEKYIEWKRKVFPKVYENRLKKNIEAYSGNPLEFIELSENESEEEGEIEFNNDNEIREPDNDDASEDSDDEVREPDNNGDESEASDGQIHEPNNIDDGIEASGDQMREPNNIDDGIEASGDQIREPNNDGDGIEASGDQMRELSNNDDGIETSVHKILKSNNIDDGIEASGGQIREPNNNGDRIEVSGAQIRKPNINSDGAEASGGQMSEPDNNGDGIEASAINVAQTSLEYDRNFGANYAFIESSESRFYPVPKITLGNDKIRKLKSMKDMPAYDGSFVSYLLQCIFGANVLKNSSAKGGVSNFNGNSHEALDAVKLKFIEDLFTERTKGNHGRLKTFLKMVNKKCNNARRSL